MKKIFIVLVLLFVSSNALAADQLRLLFVEDIQLMESETEQDKAIGTAREGGFNTLVFGLAKGRGRQFQKCSSIEPTVDDNWSVSGSDDPLRRFIQKGKAAGLKMIPVVFVSVRSRSGFRDEWLVGGSTTVFDLNLSAYRDYIVSLIDCFVSEYQADGIFFDYVRQQGVGGYSQAENIANVTDIVTRLVRKIRGKNPKAVILAYANHGNLSQGTDILNWLERGLIDMSFQGVYNNLVSEDFVLSWTSFDTNQALLSAKYQKRYCPLINNYEQDSPPTATSEMPATQFIRNANEALQRCPHVVGVYLHPYTLSAQIEALRAVGGPFENDARFYLPK